MAQPASGGAGPSSGSPSNVPWIVAGALMVVLIVVVVAPQLRQEAPPPRPAVAQPAASGAMGTSGVDLASMTPREAADRLFTRVMQAVSRGDSSEVSNFLPLSIAAYERARPLDADGMFHLALLQLTGLDLQGARATADAALEQNPGHLLLLSVAAEAAVAQEDGDAAAAYYQQLLDGWDEQIGMALSEYDAHATMLPDMQTDAQAFLDGR